MLQQIFDRIYIINLKSRSDRRRRIAAEMKQISAEIDGERIQFFEAIRPESAGDFPSIGARGCFYSHLGAIRRAEKESRGAFLILEDDVVFARDFEKTTAPAFTEITEKPWDVFYGGYDKISVGDGAAFPVDAETAILTAHCVGFKAELASTLADYLEAMASRPPKSGEGGPMHVDGAYSWFRRAHPDLTTLAASKPLAYQSASRSDITPSGPLDNVPVIRDIVQLARELRRNIRK